MSGLEVAGLVVGAFPLAISALEHYHEAHKAIFRVETEYRKTLEDVKDEQLLFRLVLEQLLSPLCANDTFSDGDIETLLGDPAGAAWSHETVGDLVIERLGRAHDRFIQIAQALQTSLSKLLSSLVSDKPQLQARMRARLDADANGPHAARSKLSATALHNTVKRQLLFRKEQLEMGVGKPVRDQLVREIHRDNKKLARLLETSDKISTMRTARTVKVSPRAIKSLLQYSEHADRIHALVRQSWECKCRDKHCAHLWLQHRRSPIFEMQFLVLFAPQTSSSIDLQPWDRQGIRITWEQAALQAPTVASSAPSPTKGSTAKKKRKVEFVGLTLSVEPKLSRALPLAGKPQNVVDQTSIKACHQLTARPSDISKLCEAMATCGMQSVLIGSFSSNQNADKVYAVHSEPQQKVTGDGVSLQHVLQGATGVQPKRSERFRIALAIASSHLQLRSTPWARRQWDAGDVSFPKNLAGDILYDKPYVSASFDDDLPIAEKIPKRSDRSFACLGIMLLELLFGQPLEDHDLWQQPGFAQNKGSALHRLMVAKQWADVAEDEGGEPFSDAIKWCLNDSPTTLTGDLWRKDLADRVVLPLEQGCSWIRVAP